MFLNFILILISLLGLTIAAGIFLKGAKSIGKKYGLSDFIIGSVIVAMGTSAPELAINIAASLKNEGDIVISNLIGSNIVNICLGFGLAATLVNFTKVKSNFVTSITIGILATATLLAIGFFTKSSNGLSTVPLALSFYFLGVFILYMIWTIKTVDGEDAGDEPIKEINILISILYLISGCIAMRFFSIIAVDNSVSLAVTLGIPTAVIGATFIAAGGSLPEVFSCVLAAKDKKPDIVIGNIAGSQVFNLIGVLAVSGLISKISYSSNMLIDISILLGISLIWLAVLKRPSNKILTAIIFLLLYACYAIYLATLVN